MLATQEASVHRPEDALVARCRAGDLDAFGQVYSENERHVFRFAYHLLGNREDADDVKQETFLRAYRAFPSFRNDCALRTWLLRICGNLCRDRIKSRDRRKEILFDPATVPDGMIEDAHAVDPHDVLERSQTSAAVRSALRGMPVDQRDIIILRDMEDLSYEE